MNYVLLKDWRLGWSRAKVIWCIFLFSVLIEFEHLCTSSKKMLIVSRMLYVSMLYIIWAVLYFNSIILGIYFECIYCLTRPTLLIISCSRSWVIFNFVLLFRHTCRDLCVCCTLLSPDNSYTSKYSQKWGYKLRIKAIKSSVKMLDQ